jgi:hypothetical protein
MNTQGRITLNNEDRSRIDESYGSQDLSSSILTTGVNLQCFYCSTDISTEVRITRQQTCPSCGHPLHCCRNCRFFDESAYHQCRESEAEWVSDKQSANFCDYFEPGSARQAGKSPGRETAEEKWKRMLRDLDNQEKDDKNEPSG